MPKHKRKRPYRPPHRLVVRMGDEVITAHIPTLLRTAADPSTPDDEALVLLALYSGGDVTREELDEVLLAMRQMHTEGRDPWVTWVKATSVATQAGLDLNQEEDREVFREWIRDA